MPGCFGTEPPTSAWRWRGRLRKPLACPSMRFWRSQTTNGKRGHNVKTHPLAHLVLGLDHMRDWPLCSKCGSRVPVLEAEGRQKIVIEIGAGRTDPTLPLTAHRQAIRQDIKRAIGPYQLERKIANVKGGMRKRMVDMFMDNFRQYKAQKWDKYMTAQAMGIETNTLEERMRTYEKRGGGRKNGRGGEGMDTSAQTRF